MQKLLKRGKIRSNVRVSRSGSGSGSTETEVTGTVLAGDAPRWPDSSGRRRAVTEVGDDTEVGRRGGKDRAAVTGRGSGGGEVRCRAAGGGARGRGRPGRRGGGITAATASGRGGDGLRRAARWEEAAGPHGRR